MLQSVGSQRVRRDLATEQQQQSVEDNDSKPTLTVCQVLHLPYGHLLMWFLEQLYNVCSVLSSAYRKAASGSFCNFFMVTQMGDCNNGDPCSHHIWLGVNVCVELLGNVRLFATPWTVAPRAPLSMGFARLEYWRGLPLVEGIHLQTFLASALCDMFWALRGRRWFLSLWTCSQPCTQIIEIKRWKSLFWEHQPEKTNQFLRGKPRTESVHLIAWELTR